MNFFRSKSFFNICLTLIYIASFVAGQVFRLNDSDANYGGLVLFPLGLLLINFPEKLAKWSVVSRNLFSAENPTEIEPSIIAIGINLFIGYAFILGSILISFATLV